MELRAPYGISITTFECGDSCRPIVTHIFWGQTEEEAIGYAKSHLITDYFFSSSFVGQMAWRNSVLQFRNSGELIQRGYTDPDEGMEIVRGLASEAARINYQQRRSGVLMAIQKLSTSEVS
jgi:hypothetical protein